MAGLFLSPWKVRGAGDPCAGGCLGPPRKAEGRAGAWLGRTPFASHPIRLPSHCQVRGRETRRSHTAIRTAIGEYKHPPGSGPLPRLPPPLPGTDGRTPSPDSPPVLVPGLPPPPSPGPGSPSPAPQPPGSTLPSGKGSARFYARLPGGDPRRKSRRQVPQPPRGVPNAAVRGRLRRVRDPRGPALPSAAPFARGKALCAGTPAPLGLTGTHSPVARSNCPRSPCPRVFPGGPQSCPARPGGFHVLQPGERARVPGLSQDLDGTLFSSRSNSEITKAGGKSREWRCRPSRHIPVEKGHASPRTG